MNMSCSTAPKIRMSAVEDETPNPMATRMATSEPYPRTERRLKR
jgi:hypothetical protein